MVRFVQMRLRPQRKDYGMFENKSYETVTYILWLATNKCRCCRRSPSLVWATTPQRSMARLVHNHL